MLLELKNISKFFLNPHGQGMTRAVDGVDLSIIPGQNFGLVGESGSGKTTLGRIVVRLYSPDLGRVFFSGKDITGLSSRQLRPLRREMQMVFQDPFNSLDPRYSIRGILLEALGLKPNLSKRQRIEQMDEVLAAVGLGTDSLNRFPHEFSGGERQRIAIARALVMRPKLVILDEALSSLDVLIQDQMIELLERLQRQYALTYWFISHNLRAVRTLCPRIAVMCQGKIVEMADAEQLFHNPLHPYTRQLLNAAIAYQVNGPAIPWDLGRNSQLIDQGNGHFVLM